MLGCFVCHHSQSVIYLERPVENIDFWSKFTSSFNTTHCVRHMGDVSTSQIDFSVHSGCTDKPCLGPINQGNFSKIYGYTEFVTPSGTFNLNFPKNHDFDDLGKAMTENLYLMCPNGPEWWVGAQGCLERDL